MKRIHQIPKQHKIRGFICRKFLEPNWALFDHPEPTPYQDGIIACAFCGEEAKLGYSQEGGWFLADAARAVKFENCTFEGRECENNLERIKT